MAAAPLRPPPNARFRAAFKSNCGGKMGSASNTVKATRRGTHVDVIGVYPSFDEDCHDEHRNNHEKRPPYVLPLLRSRLLRVESRSAFGGRYVCDVVYMMVGKQRRALVGHGSFFGLASRSHCSVVVEGEG
jgi:hypothetical protein